MRGAVLVAIAASIGNMLQGWDNATIAGSVLYIKKEFNLESKPTIEGLIVAMSLIGATAITTCSGPISDWLGRRPMLILSSVLYFVSGLVMLWAPNVYVLLLARLLDGFGIGLVVTLVPVYISETAPPEIRGLLNTLPQFTGSGGMFLSYCMVFGMSLMVAPSWRLMLGVLSIPSLIYFVLTIFFLPESPRWLVSKGRMHEAKQVLQRLRGREDVSGEMALLVEGLGVGGETSIEEYIIGPANDLTDDQDATTTKDQIKLYGAEEGLSWVARPITGQSTLGLLSRHGSMESQGVPLMDPMVTLFDGIHEKLPEQGSMHNMLFPNFGSMYNVAEHHVINEQWDEESLQKEGEGYASDAPGTEFDDNLRSPLISRQTSCMDKDMVPPASRNAAEQVNSTGIGGGWQLAWKWSEKEGEDGNKGGLKRIYLHKEDGPGRDVPEDGEFIQAAALVSQSVLYSKEHMDQHPVGPAMVQPSEAAAQGPRWSDLFEPGVRHALIVGIGIQILQQFSGINGVLYYTPQILEQAGVEVLLSNMGIGSDSASLLISAVTTLLMLPCIAVAMRLMDISGRRRLLLTTIPVLIVALVILVIANVVAMNSVLHAVISTIGVVVYFCFFVMGFGPIPNILCSEIFPTRVRGLCIAICSLVFWSGDIIVTYSLPVMLTSIGLAGVFSIYAVVCIISWVFVYLKVPETKGMPLEVISEFFAVGAKQQAAKNN
ncbi:Sugar/inositol transporter [Macleaya cordata]|uniref:Sugar/inositol transporter n=1 Tax=Macleaya cordata TaxID=56857 RepID=A0A200PR53_MACCD|nr:Sugar/inositol transporter [Macleaya cordata]